jgi:phosphate:Na+ symporter
MNYSVFDFLTLVGSLGLFLFGMKIMSEGIQKIAGDKMRAILGAMTRNRVMGVLTGLLITTVIQSSSATTVMVVSFVNAGLLTLVQAIGVIMGANIGTTATAWIISLLGFKVKMMVIAIPIVGIGFPMLFSKKDQLKSLGEFLIGFGVLFIGLDFLKSSVPDLQSSPEALEFLKDLTGMGHFSTLIFIVIGSLLTIIVQSSSAAMALTLVLCNNGWIGFEAGAAIVLGENIGTTITANLAALIGNVHAKRAALSHTIFNLTGVIWMFILFNIAIKLIDSYLVSTGSNSPLTDTAAMPIALSLFHTTFNIANTFLLIWFVKYIQKIVEWAIPTKNVKDEQTYLEYIESGFMSASELSVFEAKKEVIKFGDLTKRMLKMVESLLFETDNKKFNQTVERIKKYEDIIDKIEVEIADFLIKVSRHEISEETSRQVRSMLRMNNNFEKIGDLCYQMSILIERKNNEKAWFTPNQRERLKDLFHLIENAFDEMLENVKKEDGKVNIRKAVAIEQEINRFRDEIREEHFASIEKGDYNIKSGLYYNNLYSSLEKIGDHIMNINEAAARVNLE